MSGMMLPTILDLPRDTPLGEPQPCPICSAPVAIQRWLGVIYDDPSNPDDEEADHITHRILVHGETPLICFPVRRPGGAEQPYPTDWEAICAALRDCHGRCACPAGSYARGDVCEPWCPARVQP